MTCFGYIIFIHKRTNMMIIPISCHLIRCCVHFKILLGYNLCWFHNKKLLL
ncbi:hypothetical protein Hanom_Chr05g00440041 [Helianthus anomalus]